jgi:hypothetical protein
VCLYKWSIQKLSEGLLVNGAVLKAQLVYFNTLFGGDETFKVSEGWLWWWKVCEIWRFNLKMNLHLIVKQLNSFLKFCMK